MKNIMVLNLGSTSFKFKLFDMDSAAPQLGSGSVDAVGSGRSILKVKAGSLEEETVLNCPTHGDAFHLCMERLYASGILQSFSDLHAVGYKAVLAGDVSGPQEVNDALLERMEKYVSLAPAHNPVYISMMRQMMEMCPGLAQYACFETGFHATIPLKRASYGVPYEWRDWGVRRYGFHGASHSYIAWKTHEMFPEARRVISCHLGGSSSVCAILDGKSVFTSMGATPQSGLFQNNRVGDIDLFILPLLSEKLDGVDNVLSALSKGSGLKGLSGVSNDMREVCEAAEAGNENAQLALDAFADNITGYIGMETAYLEGLDVIAFTGGIGQHSAIIREKALKPLGYLGLKLDEEANREGREIISAADSRIIVTVLETDEEIMIARQVAQCIS